jgi:hypothetical protein
MATQEQLLGQLDEIDAALGRFRQDLPEMIRRSSAGGYRGDGFGSGRGFDVVGGRSAVDEDGNLLPSYSDPVGDLVARLMDGENKGVGPDPVRQARLDAQRLVSDIAVLVRRLDGARAKALGQLVEPPVDESTRVCVNCEKPVLRGFVRAGRCPECHEYRLAHAGQDRLADPDPARVEKAHVTFLEALAGGKSARRPQKAQEAVVVPIGARSDACAWCGGEAARLPTWDGEAWLQLHGGECWESWHAAHGTSSEAAA